MWAGTIPAGREFMHCDSSQRNWTVSCCPGCHCPLEKELFWCLHRDIKLQQSMSANESPVLGVGGTTSPKDGLEIQCLAWWTLEQTHCLRCSSPLSLLESHLYEELGEGTAFKQIMFVTVHLQPVRWTVSSHRSPQHWWMPSLPSNWMTLP